MDRFTGIIGLIVFPLLLFLLSTDRKAIRWKTIGWGFGLQISFAFIVLKWKPGIALFKFLGDAINRLLNYSQDGSAFLFGPLGTRAAMKQLFSSILGRPVADNEAIMSYTGIFATQVLPTIIFVAALFAILYYLGVMQFIVRIMAVVMTWLMGASGAESLNVAASIFMGQTEAPLTIRPYLADLTMSELMVVMTSGMAHISGGVMAAYISFGARPEHLLTAVIMTAPGTIMMAKLLVPETGEPKTAGSVKLKVPRTDVNVIDAASRGTSDGLHLALNVGAMLISFIAIIALINGIFGLIPSDGKLPEWYLSFHQHQSLWNLLTPVTWLFHQLLYFCQWITGGIPMSLQRIFGLLFSPVAWVMGVPWKDCSQIGNLLGTRLVLNEFIAYANLGPLKGVLDPKSFTIATFALCGFANFSSIGIQIGGIGALAPTRRHDLAKLGFRAVLAGTMANFLTASIAGVLLSF